MPNIEAALIRTVLLPASCVRGETPPSYAGSETCGTCHDDIFKAFGKIPHHLVDTDKERGWDGKACESCHGRGQKHAEAADAALIRSSAKLTATATDRICLTCHLNTATRVGRLRSSHAN